MQIIIHPAYRSLAPWIEALPDRFGHEGESIYKERNEIKRIRTEQIDVAVKSFRIPHLANRIAYTFFRPSKAKRSYRNAQILLEKGIGTPHPIACIEEKTGGLLARSFYVSEHISDAGLLRELRGQPLREVQDLAEAFAHFTAGIHRRETLHCDYSPGNILYRKDGEQTFSFYLVDINRMRFDRPVDAPTAAFNLRKLWGKTETILFIAGIYARDRGFDEAHFKEMLLHYRHIFWSRYIRKHPGAKCLVEE
ncbi:MAG: lipopolysaccharide kinase InaA family protein [Tannerellaceae bacterium]|jgi:tRNA A-37 threonylcarbamoyl transferase component Bud32|nr:lipopolysaccharide kinase InaA family protein [Tannerellaceae bacterium]